MKREEVLKQIEEILESYNIERLRLIERMLTMLSGASERTTKLSALTISSLVRHAK